MNEERLIHIMEGAPLVMTTFPTIAEATRLGVVKRFWERVHVFSKTNEYAFALEPEPHLTSWQVVLAHTVYNPTVRIVGQWVEVGPYAASRVVHLVRKGLERDDDIIQQWFSAAEGMKLLEGARSYEEMLIAVEAVSAGSESDEEALGYIERILGPRSRPE